MCTVRKRGQSPNKPGKHWFKQKAVDCCEANHTAKCHEFYISSTIYIVTGTLRVESHRYVCKKTALAQDYQTHRSKYRFHTYQGMLIKMTRHTDHKILEVREDIHRFLLIGTIFTQKSATFCIT